MSVSPTFDIIKKFLITVFSKFGSVSALVLTKWKFSFTIFFVILMLSHATISCFQEKSFKPFIDEVGNKLLRIDNTIYESMIEFEENERVIPVDVKDSNLFEKIFKIGYYYLDVLGGLWFLSVYIYAIYMLLSRFNTSEVAKYFMLSLVIVFAIQMVAGFIVFMVGYNEISGNTIQEKTIDLFKQINPVKGLYKLLVNIPYLVNPVIESTLDLPIFAYEEGTK